MQWWTTCSCTWLADWWDARSGGSSVDVTSHRMMLTSSHGRQEPGTKFLMLTLMPWTHDVPPHGRKSFPRARAELHGHGGINITGWTILMPLRLVPRGHTPLYPHPPLEIRPLSKNCALLTLLGTTTPKIKLKQGSNLECVGVGIPPYRFPLFYWKYDMVQYLI